MAPLCYFRTGNSALWTQFVLNIYKVRKLICDYSSAARCRSEMIIHMYSTPRGLDQHEDFMTWKDFPHYWPFVRGIHDRSIPFIRASNASFSRNPVISRYGETLGVFCQYKIWFTLKHLHCRTICYITCRLYWTFSQLDCTIYLA